MGIGKEIKRKLIERKITQKEFSKQIGISETSISQIITGVFFPSMENLNKICEVLDVELIITLKDKIKYESGDFVYLDNERYRIYTNGEYYFLDVIGRSYHGFLVYLEFDESEIKILLEKCNHLIYEDDNIYCEKIGDIVIVIDSINEILISRKIKNNGT